MGYFIAQMKGIDEWNKDLRIFLMCPENFFRNRQKAIFTTNSYEKHAKSNISKSTQSISTNKVSNESIWWYLHNSIIKSEEKTQNFELRQEMS